MNTVPYVSNEVNIDLYQVLFHERFQMHLNRDNTTHNQNEHALNADFVQYLQPFNRRLFFNGTDTQPSQHFCLVHWAVGVDEHDGSDVAYAFA